MLPGGQFQNFPIPNPVSGLCPHKIVAGPDGNLWFQYGSGLKIGRLTTAGVYTDFQLTSGTDVHDIAAGLDGNLWATHSDFVDAWVSRITPFGQVTEYPLPTANGRARRMNTDNSPLRLRSNSAGSKHASTVARQPGIHSS